MPASPTITASSTPLVVDLDQSLVRVDLLHEALARLGLRAPWHLVQLAWTHRSDLAAFKVAVAEAISVDPKTLPYDPVVLDHLRSEAARGRRLVLATASPRTWAQPIAEHLGFFSGVIATEAAANMKSARKLEAIRHLPNGESFAYLGNSADDIPLFDAATDGVVMVGAAARPLAHLRKTGRAFTHLSPAASGDLLRAVLRACRPVHWVKNLLIFVPAVTSWGTYDPKRLVPAFFAFVSFSLAASAIYLMNDLSDLAADRAHPAKRHRPLAAGDLQAASAAMLSLLLGAAALALAAMTDTMVLAALSIYLVLNAAYSSRLKEIPLADIILLCVFYLLRVMLGLSVLGLPQSIWFLAFLGCLFAEIAHWKRYVEVLGTSVASGAKRRSYTPADAIVLLAFGVGFAFSAALILILYLRSDEISPVYSSPGMLTLLAPILLVHNLGMWLEASRGHGTADPITFILRSRMFWAAGIAAALVLAAARMAT